MEIEKVIESLENIIEYWTYKPSEVEAVKLAILSLEKQVPRKIVETGIKVKALDVETKQVLTYSCSPCPSCGKWLTKIGKYCQYCGQKLDWETKE